MTSAARGSGSNMGRPIGAMAANTGSFRVGHLSDLFRPSPHPECSVGAPRCREAGIPHAPPIQDADRLRPNIATDRPGRTIPKADI